MLEKAKADRDITSKRGINWKTSYAHISRGENAFGRLWLRTHDAQTRASY